MNSIYIYLPWGPSVNNYYSPGSGKIRYVSASGQKFRRDVEQCINEQCPGLVLDGRLCVDVILYPPDKRKRDLDNYMKALLDALTHSGFWVDDEQIDQLQIYRGEIIKNGLILVEINQGGPVIPFRKPEHKPK